MKRRYIDEHKRGMTIADLEAAGQAILNTLAESYPLLATWDEDRLARVVLAALYEDLYRFDA